jgi:23S rRNA (pseudouridine1915-N3)-methyltransferase
MRLIVCGVGRMKAGAERELLLRYQERIAPAGRGVALGPLEIVEIDEGRARRPEERRSDEALRLLGSIPPGARVVALDETGVGIASEAFAARLAGWRDAATPATAFLIGGADGHGAAARARADLVLSFGPMTFPHQLVRVMLAEQLYRAATIVAGHPYHRS